MIMELFQHLLFSTLFTALVAAIVWIRKTDSAAFRYRLWLLAALKFAIPLAIFSRLGIWLHQFFPAQTDLQSVSSSSARTIAQLSQAWHQIGPDSSALSVVLAVAWLLGAVAALLAWLSQYAWQCRSKRLPGIEPPPFVLDMVSALSRQVGLPRQVTICSVGAGSDLAVYGVLKPVISFPCGISESLTRQELASVLTHELIHIRRWDNLAAIAVHLLACLFWFHPALWWLENRVITERELACDEAVIEQGWPAECYATAILKLCQFQFAGLGAGACGISGSSLKGRMERIMSYKPVASHRRASIILAALASVLTLAPASIGFVGAPGGATCVFAGKHYPEGAIIHQDGGHQQLCAVSFQGPVWVRTSPEVRQNGQTVVELPAVSVSKIAFCTPKTASAKNLCTCEEGGLFSPGSIVASTGGKLSCVAGQWIALTLTKK